MVAAGLWTLLVPRVAEAVELRIDGVEVPLTERPRNVAAVGPCTFLAPSEAEAVVLRVVGVDVPLTERPRTVAVEAGCKVLAFRGTAVVALPWSHVVVALPRDVAVPLRVVGVKVPFILGLVIAS